MKHKHTCSLNHYRTLERSLCVHVCILGIVFETFSCCSNWVDLVWPIPFSSPHQDSSQLDQATGCFSSRPDICSMDLTQSQAAPLLLHSSETREQHNKHTSVIQATGVAGSTKAFSLLPQPNRDGLYKPLCLTLSPKPSSLSSSPKHRPVSASHARCSKPTSLSFSPNTSNITSSLKPSSLMKAKSPTDESLLHIIDFNQQKQVTVCLSHCFTL